MDDGITLVDIFAMSISDGQLNIEWSYSDASQRQGFPIVLLDMLNLELSAEIKEVVKNYLARSTTVNAQISNFIESNSPNIVIREFIAPSTIEILFGRVLQIEEVRVFDSLFTGIYTNTPVSYFPTELQSVSLISIISDAIIAFFAGLILACLLSIILNYFRLLRLDPDRMNKIRQALNNS